MRAVTGTKIMTFLSKPSRYANYQVRIIGLVLFLAMLVIAAQTTQESVLSVTIHDAQTGEKTPVRVRLMDQTGTPLYMADAADVSETAFGIPPEAIAVMWGRSDSAEGYLLQPDGSFYVDGSFEASLPPGNYHLELSKGYEFVKQNHEIDIESGRSIKHDYSLERWINMPQRNWYSADDHIHLRRAPRDNPAILRWIAAEDIHVGNILQMGDFWHFVYSQYAWGEAGRYQEMDNIVTPGQEEPRTPEIGHTISLGANDFVRFRDDYYSFDRYFDRVHELDGVSGFAHQGMSFHGGRGMTMNVLRGKIDFLELAQFCVPDGPIHTEHYYRFLDLGFRLTALAGSDFPWCGRRIPENTRGTSQIGDARFYTYVNGEFSFENWIAAVKAGRTFATTGPIVELTVNNKLPGNTVDVTQGTMVNVTAKALGDGSRIPLENLEIIGHSKVLKQVRASDAKQSSRQLEIKMQLPVQDGIWIAARASAGPGYMAHTTPVYVTVDGGGFHNPDNLQSNIELCNTDLRELEQELSNPGKRLDNEAWRHTDELKRQISETRKILQTLGG